MNVALPFVGAGLGAVVAYVLPPYVLDCLDCTEGARIYFLWDTMPRPWAALFYGLIGFGLGLGISVVHRFRRR